VAVLSVGHSVQYRADNSKPEGWRRVAKRKEREGKGS
jgi:hypothetical protein